MKQFAVICALSLVITGCFGGGGGSGGDSSSGNEAPAPGSSQVVQGVGVPGGVSAVPPQSQ